MKNKQIFFIPLILIAVGLACSMLNGSNPNNAAVTEPANGDSSPTPTAAPTNAGSNPIPDEEQQEPPLSFTEFFEAGVESGQWTYEEGLVSILRYVAGADADDGFSGLTEVIEPEATGMVEMAKEYLQRPDADPELASEIDLYLRILFPPLDVLEQISRPKGSAFSHRLGSSQPLPVQQNQDACEDLALAGYDPDQLENADELTENPFAEFFSDCYVYVERQLGEQRIRVYYPASWEGDDGREHRVMLSLEALAHSSNTYQGLAGLIVKDLNLAFALSPLETAKGFANNFDPATEACPIAMLPLSEQYSDDQFSQAVAHEVFHCVQSWNFPNSKPYDTHSWWLEGSAEYYSNLAYPQVDLEWRHLGRFDRLSTGNSILDMAHENAPFFQFMGNIYSPEGFINILMNISAAGGRAAQEQALASAGDMETNFNLFVVEYLSSGILDSGGERVAAPGEHFSGNETVEEQGPVQFTVQPFVAMRFKVDYKQEKRFLQNPLTPDSAQFSGVELDLRQNINAWSDLPPEIRSECEKDVTYIFAITSVNDNYANYDVDVTLAEQAECDPCLLGVWAVNNDSFEDYILRIMAESGEMPDLNGAEIVLEIEGRNYLEFKEEGKINTRRDAFTIATGLSNTDNWITTMIDSQGTGTYSADGEELKVFGLTDYVNSITAQVGGVPISMSQTPGATTVNIFGQTADVPGAGGAGFSDGPQQASASYVCGDETLTLDQPDYGELLFDRVEAILPTPVPTPVLAPNP